MIKYVVASFGFTVKYVDNGMWSDHVWTIVGCQLLYFQIHCYILYIFMHLVILLGVSNIESVQYCGKFLNKLPQIGFYYCIVILMCDLMRAFERNDREIASEFDTTREM